MLVMSNKQKNTPPCEISWNCALVTIFFFRMSYSVYFTRTCGCWLHCLSAKIITLTMMLFLLLWGWSSHCCLYCSPNRKCHAVEGVTCCVWKAASTNQQTPGRTPGLDVSIGTDRTVPSPTAFACSSKEKRCGGKKCTAYIWYTLYSMRTRCDGPHSQI